MWRDEIVRCDLYSELDEGIEFNMHGFVLNDFSYAAMTMPMDGCHPCKHCPSDLVL